MPSQFNTLVQGLSIASITPQQILAAGEPIFLDIRTSADINSINTLIQSYARIHAPTYGQPIPGSEKVTTRVGNGTILTPGVSEIRKLMGCSLLNVGEDLIEGILTIGGVAINSFSAEPGTTVVEVRDGVFFSTNLPIAVSISEGDPATVSTKIASILVVQ